MFKLVTDFKDDQELRNSFNQLTRETYGFDFEEWYKNDYWTDRYIPYSLMAGDRIVANVSANIMNCTIQGEHKKYIQIGTVMTAKEYRKQGLGRELIEKVITIYKDQCDGIYLFANNNVLEYYPKFGFKVGKEFIYKKKLNTEIKGDFIKITDNREKFFDYVHNAAVNDGMAICNDGLMGFYQHNLDDVYYSSSLDAYVILIFAGNKVQLQAIIAKYEVDMDIVVSYLGGMAEVVVLDFTPLNRKGYEVSEYKTEDCTLFFMGEDLERIEREQMHFSPLSHA